MNIVIFKEAKEWNAFFCDAELKRAFIDRDRDRDRDVVKINCSDCGKYAVSYEWLADNLHLTCEDVNGGIVVEEEKGAIRNIKYIKDIQTRIADKLSKLMGEKTILLFLIRPSETFEKLVLMKHIRI